jgi:5'-nucleotidase
MKYFPSDNPGKFFIAIPETPSPFDPANDFFQLLHGNAITVSPMRLQGSDAALAAGIDGKIALR